MGPRFFVPFVHIDKPLFPNLRSLSFMPNSSPSSYIARVIYQDRPATLKSLEVVGAFHGMLNEFPFHLEGIKAIRQLQITETWLPSTISLLQVLKAWPLEEFAFVGRVLGPLRVSDVRALSRTLCQWKNTLIKVVLDFGYSVRVTYVALEPLEELKKLTWFELYANQNTTIENTYSFFLSHPHLQTVRLGDDHYRNIYINTREFDWASLANLSSICPSLTHLAISLDHRSSFVQVEEPFLNLKSISIICSVEPANRDGIMVFLKTLSSQPVWTRVAAYLYLPPVRTL